MITNMRKSESLDFKKYNTDKIQHGYLKIYDEIFAQLVDKEINLLEIGILDGGSLLLWRDYFARGNIWGIDLHIPASLKDEIRIHIFEGSQGDKAFLSEVGKNILEGFDIIIDDASHMGELTSISFWHLFENHLKPGGIYVIEDWGTGFWGDWSDGEVYEPNRRFRNISLNILERIGAWKGKYFYNHSFGMVGFIKTLVDEQGASDASRKYQSGTVQRNSKFQSVTILSSLVVIKKP
jgi:hypothetical protein